MKKLEKIAYRFLVVLPIGAFAVLLVLSGRATRTPKTENFGIGLLFLALLIFTILVVRVFRDKSKSP